MDTEALVYVDLADEPVPVGRLWARMRKGRDSASFEYDEEWLESSDRSALEPALQLGPGPFHTPAGKRIFGAIGDSAPDRWGRVLMRRAERRRAERPGETPRTLREIDYLLMVDDEARLGALRFALELGGARPKASVRDRGGHLAIAKFPHNDDVVDAVRWEAVALSLAEKAGIPVPEWRVETVGDTSVLLLRRFDRAGSARVPFLSVMSMLGANDHETRSYLELVDALRQFGVTPKADMRVLWGVSCSAFSSPTPTIIFAITGSFMPVPMAGGFLRLTISIPRRRYQTEGASYRH